MAHSGAIIAGRYRLDAPLSSCHIDGGRHFPGWPQTETKPACRYDEGDFPYATVIGEFLDNIR